jgi:hypothetical protein
MAEDLMRYDLMTQKALKAVVRDALIVAATEGLPGEHHFYISFNTNAPGVDISDRLKSQYPEEMTIVLQHQFWDLKVSDEGFSVGLSFDKTPERLVVPYSALIGFFDPSVQFGLQFTPGEDGEAGATAEDDNQAAPQDEAPKAAKEEPAGEVVSLDAFRKDR